MSDTAMLLEPGETPAIIFAISFTSSVFAAMVKILSKHRYLRLPLSADSGSSELSRPDVCRAGMNIRA